MILVESYFNRTAEAIRLPDDIADIAREHSSEVTHATELLVLASALAACPAPEGAIVVEIGTYRGQAACFIGRALRALGRTMPVLSVDAFDLLPVEDGNVAGDHLEYQQNVRKHSLTETCMVVSGLSSAVAPLVPARIAVLVVDGGHSYEQVRDDLRSYAPKLLPGGIMFLDDYSPSFPGVVRAADEFFRDTAEFEIVHQTRNVLARRAR